MSHSQPNDRRPSEAADTLTQDFKILTLNAGDEDPPDIDSLNDRTKNLTINSSSATSDVFTSSFDFNESDTECSFDWMYCRAESCPIGKLHYIGFYTHNDNHMVLGQQWPHENFGYSNPPPEVWAAFMRLSGRYSELDIEGDGNTAINSWIAKYDPFGVFQPEDARLVSGFIHHHAIHIEPSEGQIDMVKSLGKAYAEGPTTDRPSPAMEKKRLR